MITYLVLRLFCFGYFFDEVLSDFSDYGLSCLDVYCWTLLGLHICCTLSYSV